MRIIQKAMLGYQLHEVYSNSRIDLAVKRQMSESMMKNMMRVDVTEVFSPERIARVAESTALSLASRWT